MNNTVQSHYNMVSYNTIVPAHKSHIASDKYPTMHHFVTEMCTHVHISVTKWCIVGYGTGALWDLCSQPIDTLQLSHKGEIMSFACELKVWSRLYFHCCCAKYNIMLYLTNCLHPSVSDLKHWPKYYGFYKLLHMTDIFMVDWQCISW